MNTRVIYAGVEYDIAQDSSTIRNKLANAVKNGALEWILARTTEEPTQSVSLALGRGIPLVIVG